MFNEKSIWCHPDNEKWLLDKVTGSPGGLFACTEKDNAMINSGTGSLKEILNAMRQFTSVMRFDVPLVSDRRSLIKNCSV